MQLQIAERKRSLKSEVAGTEATGNAPDSIRERVDWTHDDNVVNMPFIASQNGSSQSNSLCRLSGSEVLHESRMLRGLTSCCNHV